MTAIAEVIGIPARCRTWWRRICYWWGRRTRWRDSSRRCAGGCRRSGGSTGRTTAWSARPAHAVDRGLLDDGATAAGV